MKTPCNPDEDGNALARHAQENPYRFFSQAEVRRMFGFGEDAMKALAERGAPIVAKKINPDHFKRWLYEHHEDLGKLVSE